MSREPKRESELVEVFSSIDPMQVRIARDLLSDSGIECFVFDEETSRMLGTTAAIPARLMVHAARKDEAQEQLKNLGFGD